MDESFDAIFGEFKERERGKDSPTRDGAVKNI